MSGAPAVSAPFLAATMVLAGAGVAKLRRPDYTARALQATGARVAGHRPGRSLVRVVAAAEIAVAVAAVTVAGPLTGALVAGAYAAFALFVLVALQRGWPLSTCGCFGRPDSRPTYLHAGLDAGAAVVAAWWATAAAPGGMGRLLDRQPWHGVPLVLLAVVIAGLGYQIWSNPVTRTAQLNKETAP